MRRTTGGLAFGRLLYPALAMALGGAALAIWGAFEEEAMRGGSAGLSLSDAGVGLGALLLGSAISLVALRIATFQRLSPVRHALECLADGNLAEVAAPRERGDEIDELLSHYLVAAERLTSQLEELRDTVRTVRRLAEAAGDAAQDSASGTEALSGALDEISRGAEAFAEAHQEVLERHRRRQASATAAEAALRVLAASGEEVTARSRRASSLADESAEKTVESAETIQQAVRDIADIQLMVQRTAKELARAGSKSEDIGRIVQAVSDVASRTDLLAINVAIEAAHAGEAGQGFAVLSEEIRQLAERATSSAEEIARLIRGVQDAVKESVGSMQETLEVVRRASSQSATTNRALQDIVGYATDVRDLATSVRGLAERQAQEIGAVTSALDEAGRLTDDIAGMTGDHVRTVQGISASLREAADAIRQVARVASSSAQLSAQTLSEADRIEGIAAGIVTKD